MNSTSTGCRVLCVQSAWELRAFTPRYHHVDTATEMFSPGEYKNMGFIINYTLLIRHSDGYGLKRVDVLICCSSFTVCVLASWPNGRILSAV